MGTSTFTGDLTVNTEATVSAHLRLSSSLRSSFNRAGFTDLLLPGSTGYGVLLGHRTLFSLGYRGLCFWFRAGSFLGFLAVPLPLPHFSPDAPGPVPVEPLSLYPILVLPSRLTALSKSTSCDTQASATNVCTLLSRSRLSTSPVLWPSPS